MTSVEADQIEYQTDESSETGKHYAFILKTLFVKAIEETSDGLCQVHSSLEKDGDLRSTRLGSSA
jgi:hypothetical protein